MRYWVQAGGQTFTIVVRDASRAAVVEVDGRPMEFQFEDGAPGIYTLLIDSKPYDLAVAPRPGGYFVAVRGVPFDVQVEDERQHRLSSASTTKAIAEGQVSIRAPMPGRVTQVDVIEGDQVEQGSRLLVLEAMKMENDIRAPRTGRVRQVKVNKGQIVEQGGLLVILE